MSTTTAPPQKLSPSQGVALVTEREVLARVRSKAFIISTLITLLAILGASIWLGITLKNNAAGDPIPVAATAAVASELSEHPMLDVQQFDSEDAALEAVRDKSVDAAVLPGSEAGTLKVVGLTSPPEAVVGMLSIAPEVDVLDANGGWSAQRYIIALVFGMIFVMACMTFGTGVATTVIEEKQTRVVEILLASVPARVLLAGKVIANTILATAQVLLFVAAAAVGLMLTGQGALLSQLSASLLWFAAFFVVGFVLVASVFTAGASLVSRQEDAGSVYTPAMMIVFAAAYGPMFLSGNSLAMTVMSYIPFTAPVAMPVRLYMGDASWWEPIVSLVLCLATTVLIIVIGGKIYENSILRMGGRVKLSDALKGS